MKTKELFVTNLLRAIVCILATIGFVSCSDKKWDDIPGATYEYEDVEHVGYEMVLMNKFADKQRREIKLTLVKQTGTYYEEPTI